MASKFKIGDLVWAKMKGFPAWPGKIIEPKSEVKRPADKKTKQFVFFFGSENYAWVLMEQMWPYVEYKSKFLLNQRIPKGFKEAVECMEDVVKNLPHTQPPVKSHELPSIDDELAEIFHGQPTVPRKDTLSSKAKKKRAPSPSEMSNTSGSSTTGRRRKSTAGRKKEERPVEKKSSPVAARDKGIFDMLGSMASQNKEEKAPKPVKKRQLSPAVAPSPPKRGKMLGKLPASPHKSAHSAASAVTSTTDPTIRDQNNAYDFFEDFLHSQGKKEEGDGVVPDVSPAHADAAPPKNVIATPMKIGFLGLGLMGSGMVNNLLISGHEVTVWNRTPSKCREFVKDCALKGNSPAEVVQQCDITFSCVSDPTALKDLVFGNCGVLQGISQGKAYIDMSTVDVDTITDVHEAVTARGGRFLEAPVIGSRQPSEDGSLIILAAGERSLYDDCYSCFQAMGRKTFYLGEIGSAAKMKLVTNMLMGTVLAGLAEALALAEKVGLEQDEVLQILELSPIACPFIKTKGQAMQKGDFTTHFSLENHQKDLRLAVGLADTVDQPLHVASSVNELFKKAKAKGYGEHDTAAVYRAADL